MSELDVNFYQVGPCPIPIPWGITTSHTNEIWIAGADEWGETLENTVECSRAISPFRAWLGHVLYVIGQKITGWSQIVAYGRRDWYLHGGHGR